MRVEFAFELTMVVISQPGYSAWARKLLAPLELSVESETPATRLKGERTRLVLAKAATTAILAQVFHLHSPTDRFAHSPAIPHSTSPLSLILVKSNQIGTRRCSETNSRCALN